MSERGNQLLHFLDYYCGIPLTVFAAACRKSEKIFLGHSSHNSRTGILCPGAIGDLLLLSGLINGVKQKLPDTHIEVIASSANACVLPLLANMDSGKYFPATRPDLAIRHIRKQKYDILFDASQWARLGNILCNFSAAGRTVGFRTPGQYRSCGYDLTAAHSCERHEIDNFLALGKAVWPDFTGVCGIKVAAQRGRDREQYGRDWIFCHMWPAGKKSWLKQWPEGHWRKLMQILLKRGFKIALTGSHADEKPTEEFIGKYFPDNINVASLAGKTTLAELAWLFGRCGGFVSVNTGIMHLGALAGAPTVGLHGPTNPCRWGPVGRSVASVAAHYAGSACLNLGFEYQKNAVNQMAELPVEEVLEALDKVMGL